MKALLCYHSQSGNTALACHFLCKRMDFISWDCFDAAAGRMPEIQIYDVVGFASWTYFLRLPPFFEQFLNNLPVQMGKPAFLLNTFGVMPGQVLIKMKKILTARGYAVLDGYSLHMPESYPPYILKGWGNLEAPTPQEIAGFENYAIRLTDHLKKIQAGQATHPEKIKLDIFSHLIPMPSLPKVRLEMGTLAVDAALCDQCGVCKQVCLYDAIGPNLPPDFIAEKCQACWACFNHCPQQAIFTDKIRGTGHYGSPAPVLTARLGD